MQFHSFCSLHSGCSALCRARLLCVIISAWCLVAESVAAETNLVRSTKWAPSRAPDELDLPRYELRVTRLGWEVRTRHFVVLSTISEGTAREAAAVAAQTWDELGRLADGFTEVHRQPTFGIGSVSILVTDQENRQFGATPSGPGILNAETDVYLMLPSGSSVAGDQARSLKRELGRSFFRVTQLDQSIPFWVQDGLSEYVALGTSKDRDISSDGAPVLPSRFVTFERNGRGQVPQSKAENPIAARMWVHYLLEGQGGAWNNRFQQAIREAIAANPIMEQLPAKQSATWKQRVLVLGDPQIGPVGRLLNDGSIKQGWTERLKDSRAKAEAPTPDADNATIGD